MADPIKHPPTQISTNDQHCGRCGKRLFGTWPTGQDGWGPCETDADTPNTCDYLINRVWQRHQMQAAGRDNPKAESELAAMLSAAGVTTQTADHWRSALAARDTAAQQIRKMFYAALAEPPLPSWLADLSGWISGDDTHGDIRLIELLRHIMAHDLSPQTNGTGGQTMGEIQEWHNHLSRRVSEVLSDAGDYETSED